MTDPFLAVSEVTGRIYIVVNNRTKIDVTDKAIKMVKLHNEIAKKEGQE